MGIDAAEHCEAWEYVERLISCVDFLGLGQIIDAYDQAGRRDEARQLAVAVYALGFIGQLAVAKGDPSDEAMGRVSYTAGISPAPQSLVDILVAILRDKGGDITDVLRNPDKDRPSGA